MGTLAAVERRLPQHCFTDRYGGVSDAPYDSLNLGDHVGDDPAAVAENRRRAARPLGDPPVVWMTQVHGREVAVVDGHQGQPVPDVDGLVTTTPGLALGVLVADCVPVLLTAPGVVAVAHAGRNGMQLGVVPAVLEVMGRLGAMPARIRARLGPSVCGACYEVPAAMRDEVAATVTGSASTTRSGTPGIDLRAGLAGQLRDAGVRDIDISGTCTVESPAYFSYRRDGRTGRFAGLVRCAATSA